MMAIIVFNKDSYLRRWDTMRLPRVLPGAWEACKWGPCEVAYLVESVDDPENLAYNLTGNEWVIAYSTGETAESIVNMSQMK
jgi:hypothetical protein